MLKKWKFLFASVLAVLLLSGCNMLTVEQMYSPPKRPDTYKALQLQIDRVMPGLEYHAPLAGENRQSVQTADLDGDGEMEYLLFTRGGTEKPLRIFVFSGNGEDYALLDTVEFSGAAFELVEYVQMDDRDGLEIVVGRQISDQVLRNVSVLTLQNGKIEQLMTSGYSKFVCCDLDMDQCSELLVLRPGESDTDNGIAELYGMENGVMERSAEEYMSEPVSSVKRIMVGKLQDNVPAVYVASSMDGKAMITDVYAILNGVFKNISLSNDSVTGVQTLRNYYVYADDIDDDGVLELPNLITMNLPQDVTVSGEKQYIICWYSLDSNGGKIEKMYTYHNYVGGWYIRLNSDLAPKMGVIQQGNSYIFSVLEPNTDTLQQLWRIYSLTGQKREEQAQIDNRFVLYRTESTVYAANLDVASAIYGISKDALIDSFRPILQDWNTGET